MIDLVLAFLCGLLVGAAIASYLWVVGVNLEGPDFWRGVFSNCERRGDAAKARKKIIKAVEDGFTTRRRRS